MKTKIDNVNDYDFFVDGEGNVTGELKRKSLAWDKIRKEKNKSRYYITDSQFSEKSARKIQLFSQIQAIADYANDGWVADWNNTSGDKWLVKKSRGLVSIDGYIVNFGIPYFKTKQLAQQAYDENKELFDEFFNL